MSIQPGTRFGPYEVAAKIGEGGMGEVYRARDTALNRDVAIKVLPEALADDPDRLARFQREAQSLAALNHPNIATIYGIEEVGDQGVGAASSASDPRPHSDPRPRAFRALVMELVDGEDLSERIARGAMSVDDALPIARQIAEALEAAHERGIIHRDLKPANIKVKDDGIVKVLDFGLAKAMEGNQGDGSGSRHQDPSPTSPTMTSPAMTAMGMILGTAAYMSPEQAKGQTVDKRADIWAFGVVLHEMLTGQSLFEAETVAETLGLIFAREPDMAALEQGTPRELQTLLRRCLEKDPRRRIRDMGDVRWHLEAIERGDDVEPGRGAKSTVTPARPAWQTWGAAAVLAVAAAGVAWFLKPAPQAPPVHLSIVMALGEHVTSAPAISPDGTTIAYAAGRSPVSARLYLRPLDGFEARVVDGSDGAVHPFFSPDSQSVAFFADGRLWRAPVAGGLPESIVEAAAPWGGAWMSDDTILYAPGLNSGLLRVFAAGGTPEQLTTPDGAGAGYAHVFPQALPGRQDVLFTVWGQPSYVAMLDPRSAEWDRDQRFASGEAGRYATSGHLLTTDLGGGLSAWPFDPDNPDPAAQATLVLDDVYWGHGADQAWADISTTGTLAYVPGSPTRRHLVWVDRDGQVDPISTETEPFVATAVSHDGERIAHLAAPSLRIQDLRTGGQARIPVPDDTSVWPGGWMPDGRLVISTNRDGDWDLFTVDTTGGGDWTPLLTAPHAQHPMDVSPSGVVVYLERHPETGSDLWTVTLDGEASPFVVGQFNQEEARFSPDEQWIAYVSNDSGRKEVYVQPWPGPGDRVQVSVSGGTGPTWSPDGRELLYREDDFVVSVAVDLGDDVTFGARVPVLDMSAFESAYFHEFDLSADGERFLMIQSEPDARRTQINVLLNWFEELKRVVPAR